MKIFMYYILVVSIVKLVLRLAQLLVVKKWPLSVEHTMGAACVYAIQQIAIIAWIMVIFLTEKGVS